MGALNPTMPTIRPKHWCCFLPALLLAATLHGQQVITNRMEQYMPHPPRIAPITLPFNGMPAANPALSTPAPGFSVPPRPLTAQELDRRLAGDLAETPAYRRYMAWMAQTKYYRATLAATGRLSPDRYSLADMVYLVENAYMDDSLPYGRFRGAVRFYASLVKQILKREKLDTADNLALNYGIQKLFSQDNRYYDARTKTYVTIPRFGYRFEDYEGKKDYRNVFASKALATGKGQCHSLPLVYLCIAEELGAKAWLSLAPNHSFIQFMDKRGRLLDFETTNGNIVSGSWMAGSGYINANALRNKTYLDTLSRRQLYARCLSDLLLGYLDKFDDDEVSRAIRDRILRADPANITVLLVDANVKQANALREIRAAGMPKPADLPKYPKAFKAVQDMRQALNRVDSAGFQEMPPEAYQAWLRSIEAEKNRLRTEQLRERIRLEAKMKKTSLRNKKY